MTPPAAALPVQRFVCSGPFQENCYVVAATVPLVEAPQGGPDERGRPHPCFIIDPGAGQDETIGHVRRRSLAPAAVLLTHGHMDHIGGVGQLRTIWPDLPIWIGRGDGDALDSPQANLSAWAGVPMQVGCRPTRLLDDGEELALGPLTLRVIAAAGHSPGGVCYYCPASGDLFSGDCLFAGSIGRSDVHGGDGRLLLRNIRQRLLTLPEATRVWPGHGPPTTIGRERRDNPFLGQLSD